MSPTLKNIQVINKKIVYQQYKRENSHKNISPIELISIPENGVGDKILKRQNQESTILGKRERTGTKESENDRKRRKKQSEQPKNQFTRSDNNNFFNRSIT